MVFPENSQESSLKTMGKSSKKILGEVARVVQRLHHRCDPNAVETHALDVVQLIDHTWTSTGFHWVDGWLAGIMKLIVSQWINWC